MTKKTNQVTMNRKKVKFSDDSDSFQLTFKNTSELISFFDWVRKKCFLTNFGLNPYEWASHGYFKINDIVYCLHSPQDINGDNNWYSYHKNRKKQADIRRITDSNELLEIGNKR